MNLSIPRVFPDLDGDGVVELISSCAVTLPSGVNDHKNHIRTNLVLISGKDGSVIGRPYLVEMCTELGQVNVTRDFALQFDCSTHDGGTYVVKPEKSNLESFI